jgi:hypothetical protein
MTARGAVLIESSEGVRYVPASVAVSLLPAQPIVPVPGLEPPAVGLVATESRTMTVLRAGDAPAAPLLVCEVEGSWVALSGAPVLEVASVQAAQDGRDWIEWRGGRVAPLDVRALVVRAEAAIWRARAEREEVTKR